jgi:hypothetical protein
MFFNKVNQAESMDLSLALVAPLGAAGGKGNPWIRSSGCA